MTYMSEQWILPGLALLVEWSVRWGLIIAALAAWLALRPPRGTATRHAICLAVLLAGVLLPVAPRWGDAVVPWPPPAHRGDLDPAAPITPTAAPRLAALDPASTPRSRVSVETTPQAPDSPPKSALAVAPRPPVRAAARSPGDWRLAAMAAGLAWASIVLVLLVRMAGGWMTLARLRRDAVAADDESQGLLDECRRVLGLSRPVRVAAHPTVASPAVVGGRSAVVLVPTDWADWPEPDRRACLLHELAHLSAYDDWFKLAQEVLRIPFFFHPAVRWLLARLDRERELLCDEAVVALGSDPVAYARLLFDLARRPGRLVPVTASVRRGWLPFLDQSTVKVRIERLLEDDMQRSLSGSTGRPTLIRSLLLGGLALFAALIVGGLRVRAGAEAPAPPAFPVVAAYQATAPPSDKRAPTKFRGMVLDPDGRPVPGATIVAGCYDTGKSGHQVLKTDAEGRFAWNRPESANNVCLIAYKEGFTPDAMAFPAHALTAPEDMKLRLRKPEPFAAALIDEAGKPVAGARVRIQVIAVSSEEGNSVSIGFNRVPREVIAGSPLDDLFATTTGADGAFTFRAIAPGWGLKLAVTTADGRPVVPRYQASETVSGRSRRSMDDMGYLTAPTGKATRFTAVPAARIAGRVVTKLPGLRLAGLKASYQESHSPERRTRSANQGERSRSTPMADLSSTAWTRGSSTSSSTARVSPGTGPTAPSRMSS